MLFFFIVSGYRLIIFIFSKNQLLVSLTFLFFFFCLYIIYFCSDLYDFFPSTNSGVFCSFFPPTSLRCKARLFIWDFCFLRSACITINLPVRTAFTASYGFQIIIFILVVSRYFMIFLDFFNDPFLV